VTMTYGDMKKPGTDIRAMDRLYDRFEFGVHSGTVTYNARLPVYKIPDGVLNAQDRSLFFHSYTFGIIMKHMCQWKKATPAHRVQTLFIPKASSLLRKIVSHAVNDTEHTTLTRKESANLLAGINKAVGFDLKGDPLENLKLMKAFAGREDFECTDCIKEVYCSLLFHAYCRKGFPVAIESVVSYIMCDIDGFDYSYVQTVDGKVFSIVNADNTSELEDESVNSLFCTSFFGQRTVKQTWPISDNRDMAAFTGLMGSLNKACRDIAVEDYKNDKMSQTSFFGNEFVRCPSEFGFDTTRLAHLTEWLYIPKLRSKLMKHAPIK